MRFTKRSLRNLCGQISHGEGEGDVTKTIEVFDELGAKDPEFLFRVQPDGNDRIRNLMWATGDSKLKVQIL